MAQTVTTDMLRVVFKTATEDGAPISNAQIFKALGLTVEHEKSRVRTRINSMVSRGEVQRVGVGLYQYNTEFSPHDTSQKASYMKIWRFVRQQKSGWTARDCAMLTGLNPNYVYTFIRVFEKEGFVENIGKGKDNRKVYRCTVRAMQTPECPTQTYQDTDIFQKERLAWFSLSSAFLSEDLTEQSAASKICEACHTLLKRFQDNSVTQNENATFKP